MINMTLRVKLSHCGVMQKDDNETYIIGVILAFFLLYLFVNCSCQLSVGNIHLFAKHTSECKSL